MEYSENEQQQKIGKLIKALGIDLEFTGKEIAEILWFSLKRQELIETEEQTRAEVNDDLNDNENNTTDYSSFSDDIIKPTSPPTRKIPQKKTPIYANITDHTKQKGYGEHNLPLRIPDPPSLHKPLEFAKALRPLMQKVSSGRNAILDEIETAEETAKNSNIFIPVLKSEPEPLFDLVLVVDEYKSMTLWQHTVRELKQLIKHYGIFRDIKFCGLSSVKMQRLSVSEDDNNSPIGENEPEKILLRLGVGKQQHFAHPQELIDPTGRRLILIVSDCVASFWHNGALLPILKDWVKYQPLAIVQMLPDWMWQRTGLRLGASVLFENLVLGNSNHKLVIKELLLWKNIQLEQGIKIPVLTLEPRLALAWSQMVVGKHDVQVPGFVLPVEVKAKAENLPQTKIEQLDWVKRVDRFRMNASPVARKLASLLSAAPMICLPVVRAIQATLLPQAQPVHVAEVFLGGLLKPTVDITPDTNSEQVEYQFVDEEIRKILFKDAPVSDSQKVFDAVSLYIEKYFGKSLKDFVVLLKAPKKNGETTPAFAEIAFNLLKQLGGDYADFAEEIESSQDLGQGKQTPTPSTSITELELEPFGCVGEVAIIDFEEEISENKQTLQEWTFEMPTVNRWGETIKTRTYTASYFIETLTNSVELEMVAIPGGTFTMGSPKSRRSTYDDERPQHDVTLQRFFMGKYPVTQAQWKVIASRTDLKVERDLDPDPSRFKGDNRPVDNVNWYNAVEFCQRLSQLTGREYKLPSEAQWEYACRGVTEPLKLESGESYPPFYFGETITAKLANYNASSTYADEPKGERSRGTTPVGLFSPNPFGLYDMYGNVREWCADDWHENYENAPTDGSAWIDENAQANVNAKNRAKSGKNKENKPNFVLRGGSCYDDPSFCRSAIRYLNDTWRDYRSDLNGFRVVCVG